MKTWINSTVIAGLAFAIFGMGISVTTTAIADGAKANTQLAAHHGKKMKKKMGAVAARKTSMRAISKANKAMKAAAKAGNAKLVISAAMIIVKQADRTTRVFPKGTSRKTSADG